MQNAVFQDQAHGVKLAIIFIGFFIDKVLVENLNSFVSATADENVAGFSVDDNSRRLVNAE